MNKFPGAWSNYPFFPSGVVIISGIEQGLFVVKRTSSPECTENENDTFLLKKKKKDETVKTCQWLGSNKKKKKICNKKVDFGNDVGPAYVVCPLTCDSCGPCYENVNAKFFTEMLGVDPQYQTCKSLADKDKSKIKKMCDKYNDSHKGYKPPKEVCPKTCKTC
mmetsp:Transcript_5018/g.10095  ORF Transcript_5018/g.10095 Transcript_5018/m.10095 type:complete len:163 (-) Transcript_5018:55-543(-)